MYMSALTYQPMNTYMHTDADLSSLVFTHVQAPVCTDTHAHTHTQPLYAHTRHIGTTLPPAQPPPLWPALPAGGADWPPAPSSILPASTSLAPRYPSHLLISLLNSRRQGGSCGRGEMDGPGRGVWEGGQGVMSQQDGALGSTSPTVSQELCPIGLRWVWAAPSGPRPALPSSALTWTPSRVPGSATLRPLLPDTDVGCPGWRRNLCLPGRTSPAPSLRHLLLLPVSPHLGGQSLVELYPSPSPDSP